MKAIKRFKYAKTTKAIIEAYFKINSMVHRQLKDLDLVEKYLTDLKAALAAMKKQESNAPVSEEQDSPQDAVAVTDLTIPLEPQLMK